MWGMVSGFFSQFKVYILGGLIIAGIFGLIASHLFMYNAGKNALLANQAKLFQERDRKIVQLQKEIEDEKGKTRIIYRDRIKRIRDASRGDTCGSTVAPPDILQQLER